MPKRSNPRPPTKKQQALRDRFNAGADVTGLALSLVGSNSAFSGRPCASFGTALVVVEEALRACLRWERRRA